MRVCPKCFEVYGNDAGFCPHDGTPLSGSDDQYLGRTIASRYRLIKRLGSGGMSLVYLARHVIIDRLSAIKILRPDFGTSPAYRERFLREARAVNRINHANIVEISDVGEADGVAYLVMEYVSGESLLALIQRAALPWPRALRIGVQIAGALGRTHELGVIHRDLKPENVMLTHSAGEEDVVKLTDFGIAKIVDLPALTFSEQLFGTPGYIAPEYVEGKPADLRADIYSLGVLLYEMLTGVLPYDTKNQSELLLRPLTEEPVPLSRHVGGLPADLEGLVLRMLSRKPEARPNDCYFIQASLRDVLSRYETFAREVRPSTGKARSGPINTLHELIDDEDEGSSADAEVHMSAMGFLARLAADQHDGFDDVLDELEASIVRAEERGALRPTQLMRARELSLFARKMLPRIEQASLLARTAQEKVDHVEDDARVFRAQLGHAIDVILADRSRERVHLDAILDRRNSLSVGSDKWETYQLAAEEERIRAIDADLTYQLESLRREFDRRNDDSERDLSYASGELEGALSALRTLTSELVRATEEAAALVASNVMARTRPSF